MKKFLSFILCFVILFAFAGCSSVEGSFTEKIADLEDKVAQLEADNAELKNKLSSQLPSFDEVEVGYQLEVYPKVAFDCKTLLINGTIDATVHISSFTAKLVAKNHINENDILENAFSLYEIELFISGNIIGDNKGKKMRVVLNSLTALGSITISNIPINEDLTFSHYFAYKFILENSVIYFGYCEI